MSERMNLVIERKRWARGALNGTPSLLNERDCMCCLGFLARACGYSDEEIRYKTSPAVLVQHLIDNGNPRDTFPPGLTCENKCESACSCDCGSTTGSTPLASQLMAVNDSLEETATGRERQITEMFATIGVNASFVDWPGRWHGTLVVPIGIAIPRCGQET